MQQRSVEVSDAALADPAFVQLGLSAGRGTPLHASPLSAKEPQKHLSAPHPHRPSAIIRRACEVVTVRRAVGSEHRIAQASVEPFVRVDHQSPFRANLRDGEFSLLDETLERVNDHRCAEPACYVHGIIGGL